MERVRLPVERKVQLAVQLHDRLSDPSGTYLLGTDQLGRDVLSRLVYGARTSHGVGFAATLPSTLVALPVFR